MRVVFCDNVLADLRPNGGKRLPPGPHLGLASLVAVARNAGHDARLFDPNAAFLLGQLPAGPDFYSALCRALLDQHPDVLGFTAIGTSFIAAVKLARMVKALRPDLPILLGGPHPTILHRQIVENFDCFDVVIGGEAEPMLLPLLDSLRSPEALREVTGLVFRDGSETISTPPTPLIQDLDTLPMPALEAWPMQETGVKSIGIEVGRGCPFGCTFCSTAPYFGRRFRLKSAERIVAELDHVAERFGIRSFSLVHDMFTVNRKKVIEVCDTIKDRGYTWRCSARVDSVDAELLDHMRDAGCTGIFFGLETGSPRMQRVINKRLSIDRAREVFRLATDRELDITVSLITGFPQEEHSDSAQSLDLAGEILTSPGACNIDLHVNRFRMSVGTQILEENRDRLCADEALLTNAHLALDEDDVALLRARSDLFPDYHCTEGCIPHDRQAFTYEALKALRAPGDMVLAELLIASDVSLSGLVDALWQRPERAEGDLTTLCAHYVTETLGTRHPVASLYRRQDLLHRLAAVICPRDREQTDLSGPLRLHPRASLLTELHDCDALLSAGVPWPQPLTENVSPWLFFVPPEGEGEAWSGRLGHPMANFLEGFRQGRSVSEALAAAGLGPLHHASAMRAVRRLADAGVLVSTPT